MIYKRSSTSPRLTFADERIGSSPPQAVSRQNSVARSVTEDNIKTAADTLPKANPENHDVTDAASAKIKTEQELGTAVFNGSIPR